MATGLSSNASATAGNLQHESRGFAKRSVWTWWHLLSLDAPTVAVVWCWFFGVVCHLNFSWPTLPTLALGTWCVYVADRLLDGWRSRDMRKLRDRHWFYVRHRRPFILAWTIAAIPLAYLIFFCVEPAVRSDDVVLCLIGVAYFLLIHGGLGGRSPERGEARLFPRWLPKEMVVGFLFAIAAAVPVLARLTFASSFNLDGAWIAAAVFLFGALCWLNCVAIQTWEDGEAAQEIVHTILSGGPEGKIGIAPPGLTEFLGRRLIAFACTVGALALGASLATVGRPVSLSFTATALSAGLFLVLIRYSRRMGALSLRIAADAALLTPLLFFLKLR